MPPIHRPRLPRQQWRGGWLRRFARWVAAQQPPRKRDSRFPWRHPLSGLFAALGGTSQAHAENARPPLLPDYCRSSLSPPLLPFSLERTSVIAWLGNATNVARAVPLSRAPALAIASQPID